jgi:hypothetical protein
MTGSLMNFLCFGFYRLIPVTKHSALTLASKFFTITISNKPSDKFAWGDGEIVAN